MVRYASIFQEPNITVMIPKKDEPEHDLSTYIQYYFYPCTITGPWITLSKFVEAKNADSWSNSISISGFTSRIIKWALALAAGELFHHLFYLNCIAIDIQMIKGGFQIDDF